MAKQKALTSKMVIPKKKGKPGKLLDNKFAGFNDPARGRSRLNNFAPMEATEQIFVSGGSQGGALTQQIPGFDDSQLIPVDPTINDPIGRRAAIDTEGNTVYVSTSGAIKSTLMPTQTIGGDDLGELPDTEALGDVVADATVIAKADAYAKAIKSQNLTIGLVIAVVVVVVGYLIYKNKS